MAIVKRILSRFDDGVFRGMLILATGTGVAKIVGILVIPLLTRIYSPEDFGLMSIFSSIVLVLYPLLSFRYVVAIPLPRSDRLAINLAALSVLIILASTVLLALVLGVFGEEILLLFSGEKIVAYWWLLVVAAFMASIYDVLMLWATRKKDFKIIARSQVVRSMWGSVAKLGLGLAAVKPMGLLLGQAIQLGGGSTTILKGHLSYFVAEWRHVTIRRMRTLLRIYANLPAYRLPSQFLLIASMQAPVLFCAHRYGVGNAGQLGMALSTMAIPMSVLGTTAGNAYYAEISRVGRKRPTEVLEISRGVTKKMALLALAPCLVLLVFGEILFSFVFGPAWALAGSLASALSIYLLFQFAFTPLVNALTLFGRQDVFLQTNLVRALLVGMVFILSVYFDWSILRTMTVYAVVLSFHYGLIGFRVFSIIRNQISDSPGL